MNIEALVFDFDGIIVNSEPVHYEAYQVVLKPYGLGFSWEEYLERYMGFDDRDAFRRYFARIGRTTHARELGNLLAAKARTFQELAVRAEPFPGVVELAQAANAHVKVALCSGAMRSDIMPVITRLGLVERFSSVVTADDVERSKPDPTCYRMTVERLGVTDPSRCVAIEDSPAGIAAARAAGLRVIGVTNSHPAPTLREADTCISTLEGRTLVDLAERVGLTVASR